MTTLDVDLAARLATIALGHVTREWPHKLDHVLDGPGDARTPRDLHPIFFGSFDWHSCVHGYWMLMRLRRLFPGHAGAGAATALADAMLTPANAAAETAYLDRPSARGFERPYGWAWALALHAELARQPETRWANALEPLARAFAARFAAHLPQLTYPIRVGTHYNTAFALILARDWALDHDPALSELIAERARDWYLADRKAPAWEPGGDEFLSATLCEALLMAGLLGTDEFRDWFAAYLPATALRQPATLFAPAVVSDRSDGKIVHLDGLNLSRAWCWRGITARLARTDPARAKALAAVDDHLAAALPHVAGDFMGEHWLATFALMALEPPERALGH